MRNLYEICTPDGYCAKVWAYTIEEAREHAAKLIGLKQKKDGSLMLGLAAFGVVCLLALMAVYALSQVEIPPQVTCKAPADEGQKLTVRLVNVGGMLQEQCEYSPIGFGGRK